MFRKVTIILAVVTLFYAGVMGLMSALEAKFIFFPDYPSRRVVRPDPRFQLDYRRVGVTVVDGVRLAGWLVPSEPKRDRPMVIFFHGNAGNIGDRVHRYVELQDLGLNVLAMDYRGYGESDGQPDEAGLYLDAVACYQYVVDTLNVAPSRVILYGQSLGSAVAVELATRVPHAGLILEGAMTSVADRGQELYPFLPVKWLTRNRFDSISKIVSIGSPKLFIHAVDDEVIPFEHGRRLYAAASDPKSFLEVSGGHNACEIVDSERLYGGIRQFLSELSL